MSTWWAVRTVSATGAAPKRSSTPIPTSSRRWSGAFGRPRHAQRRELMFPATNSLSHKTAWSDHL
eukprot:14785741-Heterocapsa_arctica.AAC.1